MADWQITGRSEVFNARRWSVERSLRTRLDDPARAVHEFHTIRIADFVNVIPVRSDGRFVLVRQFRHGLDRATLEFPGGFLDPHEGDPAAAAIREMREETGHELPRSGLFADLGAILPNPAMMNNRNHFFGAVGVEPTGASALEPTEDVELVLASPDELNLLVRSREFDNAMMLAGLLLFERWRAAAGA